MGPAALAAAPSWLPPAAALAAGACVGSFLNVVIVRCPTGESIVRPGSHCACGAPVAWRDNIPVLSWLLLRGRARCCGRRISVRYPAVELLTALLFLACWREFPPAVAVAGMVFLSGLVAASFIDVGHLIIPDGLTIGPAVAGVLLSLLVPGLHHCYGVPVLLESLRSGAAAVTGLAAGSGLLLWIALLAEAVLKKEAMGFGDVKLVGAIGAFCGWRGAAFAIFGGAVVGTIWLAVAWVGRIGRRAPPTTAAAAAADGAPADGGKRVPFGPMLAIAAALYFLWLHAPVDAWFAQFAELF